MKKNAMIIACLLVISSFAHARNSPIIGTDSEFTEGAYQLSLDHSFQKYASVTTQDMVAQNPCFESKKGQCIFLKKAAVVEEMAFRLAFMVAFPSVNIDGRAAGDRLYQAAAPSRTPAALAEAYVLRRPSPHAAETAKKCNSQFKAGLEDWLSCMEQPLAERFIFMGFCRFRWAYLHGYFDVFDSRRTSPR